jgi:hypothetical protein
MPERYRKFAKECLEWSKQARTELPPVPQGVAKRNLFAVAALRTIGLGSFKIAGMNAPYDRRLLLWEAHIQLG